MINYVKQYSKTERHIVVKGKEQFEVWVETCLDCNSNEIVIYKGDETTKDEEIYNYFKNNKTISYFN
jgi:hypothetical protein